MTVINTNIAATMTANSMRENQRSMESTMERLATGKRINSASDDAAGLAIETRMDSQIRGLSQASRNANDGISLLQTADGAASEMSDMLQRMRELSVQAQNGTVGTQDISNLNQEFAALATEIDRIANDTTFNNINILSSSQQINITVGADEADVIAVDLVDFNLGAGRSGTAAAVAQVYKFGGVEDDGEAETLSGIVKFTYDSNKIATLNMDSDNMKTVDQMVAAINNDADFGAGVAAGYTASKNDSGALIMTANTAGASFDALSGTGVTPATATAGTDAEVLSAKAAIFSVGIKTDGEANSLVAGKQLILTYGAGKTVTVTGHDTDITTMAHVVTAINNDGDFDIGAGSYKASIDATHGVILTAHTLGTSTADLVVTTDATTGTIPVGATVQAADDGAGLAGTPMRADLSNFAKTNVTDSVGTAGVLAKIDNAIEGIATARANFGATINRLEYTVDNLNTTILNTQAAKSQIVDADYAAETTELARTQIISQASTAMLSQANQAAQSVLALLK